MEQVNKLIEAYIHLAALPASTDVSSPPLSMYLLQHSLHSRLAHLVDSVLGSRTDPDDSHQSLLCHELSEDSQPWHACTSFDHLSMCAVCANRDSILCVLSVESAHDVIELIGIHIYIYYSGHACISCCMCF